MAAPSDELGPDVKPPWEIDGRRWHTRDRIATNGKPVRWDGRILESVVDRIQILGAFAPTDWSQRSSVRIFGPDKAGVPFFHATTSREWVVTLRFHVPRNTFKSSALEKQLRLTPFHESPTPVLCDSERLVLEDTGPTQVLVLTCHAAGDVETSAFDAFLVKAVASFHRKGKTGMLVTANDLG